MGFIFNCDYLLITGNSFTGDSIQARFLLNVVACGSIKDRAFFNTRINFDREVPQCETSLSKFIPKLSNAKDRNAGII
jgi:hypothetical protein